VGALESKMESSRRAGREKCLCGNGLLDGSIPPAPAKQSGEWRYCPQRPEKSPPLAGICDSGASLHVVDLADSGSKTPIVSGQYLKYSRFLETTTGVPVGNLIRLAREAESRNVSGL
jgi:hypothetical protein